MAFITEAGDHYSKGDFVIDHKDAAQISDQYVIEITHVADVPQARVITEPKVYVDDDSFDRFAFTRQMNSKPWPMCPRPTWCSPATSPRRT